MSMTQKDNDLRLKNYLQSDVEKRMRSAFRDSVHNILANEDRYVKGYRKTIVGLEVEFGLVDVRYKQLRENVRNKIISNLPFADVELGASQVEIRTDKLELSDFGELRNQLLQNENLLAQRVLENGSKLVRSGSNPFVPVEDIIRTDTVKYRRVPTFHDDYKNPNVPSIFGRREKIDPRPAEIIALSNSVQCNIEAIDFADAVEKTNRSYMLAPYLISVAANARLVAGKDLGYEDTRMHVWEISHDIRSNSERRKGNAFRVGKFGSYLGTLSDYFNEVGSYPFILDSEENALKIGIGLFWKDVRIKIIGDSCVVELRPLSTQPSIAEDLALQAFYLGRLSYSQFMKEPMIDISYVNKGRDSVMRFGLEGRVAYLDENNRVRFGTARSVLPQEIEKAARGLEFACIAGADESIRILQEKVKSGITPSRSMARVFGQSARRDKEVALIAALRETRGRYDDNREYENAYA